MTSDEFNDFLISELNIKEYAHYSFEKKKDVAANLIIETDKKISKELKQGNFSSEILSILKKQIETHGLENCLDSKGSISIQNIQKAEEILRRTPKYKEYTELQNNTEIKEINKDSKIMEFFKQEEIKNIMNPIFNMSDDDLLKTFREMSKEQQADLIWVLTGIETNENQNLEQQNKNDVKPEKEFSKVEKIYNELVQNGYDKNEVIEAVVLAARAWRNSNGNNQIFIDRLNKQGNGLWKKFSSPEIWEDNDKKMEQQFHKNPDETMKRFNNVGNFFINIASRENSFGEQNSKIDNSITAVYTSDIQTDTFQGELLDELEADLAELTDNELLEGVQIGAVEFEDVDTAGISELVAEQRAKADQTEKPPLAPLREETASQSLESEIGTNTETDTQETDPDGRQVADDVEDMGSLFPSEGEVFTPTPKDPEIIASMMGAKKTIEEVVKADTNEGGNEQVDNNNEGKELIEVKAKPWDKIVESIRRILPKPVRNVLMPEGADAAWPIRKKIFNGNRSVKRKNISSFCWYQ